MATLQTAEVIRHSVHVIVGVLVIEALDCVAAHVQVSKVELDKILLFPRVQAVLIEPMDENKILFKPVNRKIVRANENTEHERPAEMDYEEGGQPHNVRLLAHPPRLFAAVAFELINLLLFQIIFNTIPQSYPAKSPVVFNWKY